MHTGAVSSTLKYVRPLPGRDRREVGRERWVRGQSLRPAPSSPCSRVAASNPEEPENSKFEPGLQGRHKGILVKEGKRTFFYITLYFRSDVCNILMLGCLVCNTRSFSPTCKRERQTYRFLCMHRKI